MEGHRERAPIACSLEQADLAERQDDWLRLAARARVEVQTTKGGFRLRFQKGPGVDREVRGSRASNGDAAPSPTGPYRPATIT